MGEHNDEAKKGPVQDASVSESRPGAPERSMSGDIAVAKEIAKGALQPREGNKLCFAVVYLAPGDYHRYHSPTNWVVERRRHFAGTCLRIMPGRAKPFQLTCALRSLSPAGELFSVSPWMVGKLSDLFVLNERVALLGRWRYGFFSMIPVGATNVGSIRVNFDSVRFSGVPFWASLRPTDIDGPLSSHFVRTRLNDPSFPVPTRKRLTPKLPKCSEVSPSDPVTRLVDSGSEAQSSSYSKPPKTSNSKSRTAKRSRWVRPSAPSEILDAQHPSTYSSALNHFNNQSPSHLLDYTLPCLSRSRFSSQSFRVLAFNMQTKQGLLEIERVSPQLGTGDLNLSSRTLLSHQIRENPGADILTIHLFRFNSANKICNRSSERFLNLFSRSSQSIRFSFSSLIGDSSSKRLACRCVSNEINEGELEAVEEWLKPGEDGVGGVRGAITIGRSLR